MRVKSEEKRQAILDVAAAVFNEVGFEAASMSAIAARVGGSKATLYNYFPSKEQLFVEVMLQTAAEQTAGIDRALGAAVGIEEALVLLGEAYLEFKTNPAMVARYRTVLTLGLGPEVCRLFYQRGPKSGLTRIEGLLKDAMGRGELRQDDAWVGALQLKALYEAEVMQPLLLNARAQPTKKEVVEVVRRAVDTFLKAYRVK